MTKMTIVEIYENITAVLQNVSRGDTVVVNAVVALADIRSDAKELGLDIAVPTEETLTALYNASYSSSGEDLLPEDSSSSY